MTRTAAPPQLVRPTPSRISYEEFLHRSFENENVEWVDGEVVEMAAVTVDHSGVHGFLLTLMKLLAEKRKLGTVLFDPFQMKTGPDLPGRAPDLLFVATKHLKRLHRLYLEGRRISSSRL